MKRIILTIIIAILAFSCAKEEPVSRILVDDILTKGDIKEDSYAVTDADIKNYLHFKQLENSELKLKSIEPFEYEGQTLLYVLNYNKGWEVISADKRTQVVLAKGDEGSFTMKDYKETPWGTWVYTLAKDVRHVKEQNIQVAYNENADYEFWGQVNGPLYSMPPVPPPVIDTTSIIVPPIILEPIENVYGYYELSDVSYIYNVDTIAVERLTTTNWNQSDYRISYYLPVGYGNHYVPKDSRYDMHVPSGCTAVAGAQLAYYLHYRLGQPNLCPLYNNECTNIATNATDSAFQPDNFRTDLWDVMDDPSRVYYTDNYCTNTQYSDMLIAYIGRMADMKYGDNISTASLINLQYGYLGLNSIECEYTDYDDNSISIVINELQDPMRRIPVLVEAYTENNPQADPPYSGHAFLIDGYKYSRKKPVYTYEWKWYPQYLNGTYIIPDVLPIIEESECEFQQVEFFQMNWGYMKQDNLPYYAPSGSWQLESYAFDCNRKMLWGFHVSN